MAIDPRWVSTPVGAAIGVALTRKLLDEKDRTFKNQVVGGGLGAGAGYMAGEFLRKDPLAVDSEGDPRANLENFWGSEARTGYASDSEIAAADKINPSYKGLKPAGEGAIPFVNDFRTKERIKTDSLRNQYNVLDMRIGYYKSKAKQARTPEERDKYMAVAKANRKTQWSYGVQLFWTQAAHGMTYPGSKTLGTLAGGFKDAVTDL